jgi:biotin carboxyl carrier protein
MSSDRARMTEQADAGERPSTAELFHRLGRFDGPPEYFLANLLAVQCWVAAARSGAILHQRPDGQAEALAVYPPLAPNTMAPAWLAEAVESAGGVMSGGQTVVRDLHEPQDLYGQPTDRHLTMIPLRGGGGAVGMAVFVIQSRDPAAFAAAVERLELTAGLLSLYELRLTVQRHRFDLARLRMSIETAAAVNEPERLPAAAMAACNEIAARWQCERVSLGFLKGRYVRLRGMSHTEKFSRKMRLIQDVEAAMEECLDQDLEVIHPSGPEATYVSRAAGELSLRHGPTVVASLPLRRRGEVVGVLTAERAADQPFSGEQLEGLRLTCNLCTPRLHDLYQQDRWIGAKAAGAMRKGLAAAVGPKHTWLKVLAIGVFVGAIVLVFGQGRYQAEAPFALEATVRQVVPAPFDGFLKSVSVKPADAVEGGKTVLASLDASELGLQLLQAKEEQARWLTQARVAERDGNAGEAEVARAAADTVAAQIQLLQYQIDHADLVSPISGVVVQGDLQRQIGAPVKKGEALFEVAPLDSLPAERSLRAELSLPEDQVADVIIAFRQAQESGGQLRGQLATAGAPESRIGFAVERINPVAEVVNQRNVFKVHARLDEVHPGMAPGMQGIARIDLDRRSYAWLWSRRLVNWVRMKLWV